MELSFFLLVFPVWVVCGVLAYGWTFAYMQREYPTIAVEHRADDRGFALFMAVLGPIGLAVTLTVCGIKHGLKWR